MPVAAEYGIIRDRQDPLCQMDCVCQRLEPSEQDQREGPHDQMKEQPAPPPLRQDGPRPNQQEDVERKRHENAAQC